MKTHISALFIASLLACATTVVHASGTEGGHSGGRNGGEKPLLQYDGRDIAIDLAPLPGQVLSSQEFEARRQKLKIVSDFYRRANIAATARAIRDLTGADVYHFNTTVPDHNYPKDNDELMDSAVRYYTGYSIKGSRFETLTEQNMSYRQTITAVGTVKVRATGKVDPKVFTETSIEQGPFSLVTFQSEGEKMREHWANTTQHAVFTSTQEPVLEAPALPEFLEAFSKSGLARLDATLVFLTAESWQHSTPYWVIYPNGGRYAPIPHPVVFILKSAREDDLRKMLAIEAPQIQAYNYLFDQQVLPGIEKLYGTLKNYPDFLDEVKAATRGAKEQDIRDSVEFAFFRVAYSMIKAGVKPLELGALVADDHLRALFKAEAVKAVSGK